MTPNKHVLAISHPTFGHMIPLMELCKRLADSGIQITFAISEVRAIEIQKRGILPLQYADKILIHSLKDGVTHDLEASIGPAHHPNLIAKVLPVLTDFIEKIAENSGNVLQCQLPVNAIVYDMMMVTPAKVCKRVGLPCYAFFPNGLYMLGMLGFPEIDQLMTPGTDEDFFLPPPENGYPKMSPSFASHIKGMRESMSLVNGILVNSSRDMEGAEVAGMLTACPVFQETPYRAVGPLLQVI